MELHRHLGISYHAAWRMKHKLMQVMMERQSEKKLAGRIEMDDAYIGGEKPGKRGRGSRNKIPFVAAVETTQDGRPLKIHLRRLRGFRKAEIARYAKSSLVSGSSVFSDGLYCFRAVTEAMWPSSPVVGEKALNTPPSNGSIPCWVTSRMLCWEPFMLFEENMYPVIWPNSNIALIVASIFLR